MREFFHGWRRKAGCVLLLTSVAIVLIWCRSGVYMDLVEIHLGAKSYEVSSCYGSLNYSQQYKRESQSMRVQYLRSVLTHPRLPYWNFTTSAFGFRGQDFGDGEVLENWYFPHWAIVGPLALVSAYLILWKPRKRVNILPRQK